MTWLSHWFGRAGNGAARPRRRPTRLGVEALEDRTVPANVFVVPLTADTNGTSFRTLADALKAAGNNGTVTIEPGAVADFNIDVTQSGLTIQGDPNVPSSILPAYNISIDANNVTLKNVNVNFVSVNPGFSGLTVTRSTVGSVFISGGPSGNGNNTITQNYITGDVSVIGNTGPGAPTNDRITNNTFTSFSASIITVSADNGAVIADNVLTGGGSISSDVNGNTITKAPQTGIEIAGGVGVRVANNNIKIAGDNGAPAGTTGTFIGIAVHPFDPATAGLPANAPVAAPVVQVLTNSVQTGRGTGLAVTAAKGATGDRDTQVLVQGNDFHNNATGVSYAGSGGGSVTTDLGGGALGSLGGNNFRGFTARGTAAAAAIQLQGVGGGAVLAARGNLFQSGASPANVVFASAGTVDATAPLTNDQAFVQTLFEDFLGRAGSVGELNFWVGVLHAGPTGRSDVITGIAKSDAGLGRVIDGFYLKYLGRQADDGGRAYWVSLIKGGATLESIQAGFIASAEFISSNNSDYIQGLYRTFLGRTGSAAELAYWYGQLPALGLGGVALGFATSAENRNTFVTHLFKDYFHRAPSAGEVSFWSAQPGDLLSLTAQILASTEFGNKG